MLNELTENIDVYLITGYSDMRKGIDGLAAMIQGNLSMNPFNKSLFLFLRKKQMQNERPVVGR